MVLHYSSDQQVMARCQETQQCATKGSEEEDCIHTYTHPQLHPFFFLKKPFLALRSVSSLGISTATVSATNKFPYIDDAFDL